MQTKILESIQSRPFTTFQDLEIDVPGFRGSGMMFSPIRESIIVWHAMTSEAIEALGSLIGSATIFMHPAPNISYRATGDLPPVPVCRSMADFKSDTKTIRWFPVVFSMTKTLDDSKVPVEFNHVRINGALYPIKHIKDVGFYVDIDNDVTRGDNIDSLASALSLKYKVVTLEGRP